MKLLFISLAASAAVLMVSCGNNTESASDAAAASADSAIVIDEVTETVVVTDEEAPAVLDNIKKAASAENVQKGLEYVKGLMTSGKLAEARTYLEQIKPYAEKVSLSSACNAISVALEKAERMAGNAKAKADSAVAGAGQAAEQAVTNAAKKLLK